MNQEVEALVDQWIERALRDWTFDLNALSDGDVPESPFWEVLPPLPGDVSYRMFMDELRARIKGTTP